MFNNNRKKKLLENKNEINYGEIKLKKKEDNIFDFLDTNILYTNIVGDAILDLSDLLDIINSKILQNNTFNTVNNIQEIVLEKANGDKINFFIPLKNYKEYFQKSHFLGNYNKAFNVDFPVNTTSLRFSSINFLIKTTNLENGKTNLDNSIYIKYFRLLTCIIFGFIFDIKLNECSCLPQTTGEMMLFKNNIPFNCLKIDCKNRLAMFPNEIDFLTYGNCDNFNVQSVIIGLTANSVGNLNLKLNIKNLLNNIENIENNVNKTT